jgi:hypothetical protein
MAVTSVEENALQLSESISLAIEEGASTVFDADGCVPVHIIRPGIGKGRGRHLYPQQMLRENAHKFTGWRMYVDHQSPEARKAAGGLPRSVRDLGGRIVESRWDPQVPADPQRGYGQGAVVGRAKPVPFIRDLIENDPQLVEASIRASATGVQPVNHLGQRVWMVEGINDRGSVDWVTEAGAGGRVAPLIEASYSSEEAVEMALLESMSDDEVREYIRETRPTLLAEPENVTESKLDQEGDMTPEQLQEALSSNPDVLVEALKGNEALQAFIAESVLRTLSEDRAMADAERDAVIDRQWELRDLRDSAFRLITESRLPDSWQEGLRERFTLREDRTPMPELDVVDDIDSSGVVVKAAAAKLQESVLEACKKERQRLAEVAPTRVRGQGLSHLAEGDGEENQEKQGEPGFHRTLLAEAGIDYDKAYADL